MKLKTIAGIFLITIALLIIACNKENKDGISNLTIIFINDQHGQLENFGKLMDIIHSEEEENEVIVACAGDMFSGNPVVDIYEQQGFPMIDLMNKIGVDISVIGNHEFDYGQEVLKERMQQAQFEWVCANVNTGNTVVPQPDPFYTFEAGNLKVTFLGLIETNGKADLDIPSTHPLKVSNIVFERPEDVVDRYADLKETEKADLYIALTHLGHDYSNGRLGDFQLAKQFPYFDLIIGGHSNPVLDTTINGIPVFQAGNYLNYAGKIELNVQNKKLVNASYEAIDLNSYAVASPFIQSIIEEYNSEMSEQLDKIIGYAEYYHDRYQLGCFYTDALRTHLETDVCFQNWGGIRHDLDQGDITVREIYEIDPFNNRAMIYTMTANEIKSFLKATSTWHAYSGIQIEQSGGQIIFRFPDGSIIDDDTELSVGINDYIPSVNDSYFPVEGQIQSFTTAEALIQYLENTQNSVNYPECLRYFKFQ